MAIHREIWKKYYGEIPKDYDGRSLEIHHVDGNRANNSIENLICVSIQEHYNIHISQGDYGAAALISKRMKLSPDHMSKIQRGKKRPDLVGKSGPKKGNIPWNKGKSGYKLNTDRSGKRFSSKISIDDVSHIRDCYNRKVDLEDSHLIGVKRKNGVVSTYESIFVAEYAEKYNVARANIRNIINYKSWKDDTIDVRKP